MARRGWWLVVLACLAGGPALPKEVAMKSHGVFYSEPMRQQAARNVARWPWAAESKRRLVEAAAAWRQRSDNQLWGLMFGPTITRSWMVWSNGYCPTCQQGVPMYTWEINALERSWKVRCPHCREFFPKNDFYRYYRSGRDEHGIFDPGRADRRLLYNAEHPDPADPQHGFGVDDGEGYVEGDRRWRFIGAYLIYGQWKQAVVRGIEALAAAYVVTGEEVYAHKAGILLDRVADLYPGFDFGQQGLVYEVQGAAGYVSTWHDACEETRQLILAYDQVCEGLKGDEALVSFLAGKARTYRLPNPKTSFALVQRNIEQGILRDALANRRKVESNYPQTDITLIMAQTVLGWPANREEVYAALDRLLERATAVDGVTGEKGLSAYSAYGLQGVARVLESYARMDPEFLAEARRRHPRLHDMYRFHIDTWCLGKYYPTCGDSGAFAHRAGYVGAAFSADPGLGPSMYSFLWRLYQLTGDAALVQVLYQGNGGGVQDLPRDLFAADPQAMQQAVADLMGREGAQPRRGSVNKREWHLAILQSGEGEWERALWLDYDAGGGHGHADGMNLGFYARGLDLLPDFGYPPVNFGGWGAPRALWYGRSAAHNTVVVDGENQQAGAGESTLWADGAQFRAVRASGPGLIGGQQYERTAVLVDVSAQDCYALDIFRVVGGSDHARFSYPHYGKLTTQGLALAPAPAYGHDTELRGFRADGAPAPGWQADWQIEDRLGYLPAGTDLHLRYTDLSGGVQAAAMEAWISPYGFSRNDEAWISALLVRRQGSAPLASTFVGVWEPYQGSPLISRVRRLGLQTAAGVAWPESAVALQVELADGRRDLVAAADTAHPSWGAGQELVQPAWGLRVEGELALVRLDGAGKPERIALCRGRSVRVAGVELRLREAADYLEITLQGGRAAVAAGQGELIERLTVEGEPAAR